jgi:hypothetical protein
MPNYCYNVLKISNDDVSKIDALEKAIKNADGVFHHLRPNPDGKNADNWYEWNKENWGTKWDISIAENGYGVSLCYEREGDDTISMTFDTAWCPPFELYNFLYEEDWVIEAYYIEEGMDFMGMYTIGESTDWEVSMITDDDYYNDLPRELIDALDLEYVREQRLEQKREEEEEEAEEKAKKEVEPVS